MERISLKTATDLLAAEESPSVAIVERPKGYGLAIGACIIRSQREDELTFLTYDAAINYARRHLAPCLTGPLLLSIAVAVNP